MVVKSIAARDPERSHSEEKAGGKLKGGVAKEVLTSSIHSNRYQPRQNFLEMPMAELVESVRHHGILQPLIVTQHEKGYELVSGERRLRAAKQLRMPTVPVIVRKASELERLELALIENIQREDLNPLEEAEAYRTLLDEFGVTQEELAKRIAKSRPEVTNTLRLLTLPLRAKKALVEGKITRGHAKTILSFSTEEERLKALDDILEQKLTVRDIERRAQMASKKTYTIRIPPHVIAKEEALRETLGTKVHIQPGKRGGKIIIEYYSDPELLSIVKTIMR